MALIKCPECGKENVSDNAISCPYCGYGIKDHYDKKNMGSTYDDADKITARLKEAKKRTHCIIAAASIAAFSIVIITIIIIVGININVDKTFPADIAMLPYNVEWGDSYDTVKRKDQKVTEVSFMDDGRYRSTHREIEISTDLRLDILYFFDSDDSLISVGKLILVSESNSTNPDELFDQLLNEVIQKYGSFVSTNPEVAIFDWETDSEHIKLCKLDKTLFTITMDVLD